MNLIMLINVKKPTIVGILTFISMINTASENECKKSLFFSKLVFIVIEMSCSVEWGVNFLL